ncbi:MAG: hypothetical protein KVP17_000335 [Porospora cf. gigantea B]|uniref:uncharacterized protein n=1 Tax=Porospora cf. gigantea B TaxID=2853592 RepID=UPI003571A788|nr:MAG: hypothetical protein KVP17_000335 [Porospora cf. gigantea B]
MRPSELLSPLDPDGVRAYRIEVDSCKTEDCSSMPELSEGKLHPHYRPGRGKARQEARRPPPSGARALLAAIVFLCMFYLLLRYA